MLWRAAAMTRKQRGRRHATGAESRIHTDPRRRAHVALNAPAPTFYRPADDASTRIATGELSALRFAPTTRPRSV